MNRRQFVWTAAGAATSVHIPDVLAAGKYDVIVKGGRVIDPSRKLDAIADVAIANGRVAAIEANVAADADNMIDARGKLVVPGLIDIHTHAARVKDGPGLCLADGVTGLIDAGSQGADRIGETIAVARSAPQPCRVLINIGRAGILPDGDTMDLSRADVGAAREAIGRNRDMIAGVKARLSRDVAGANDFEVLRRAQEAASAFHLPVMIHMGQTVSPLAKLHALRPFAVGHGRTRAEGGFPARHVLDRLDSRRPHCPSHRLSERDVEVPDAEHVDKPSDRVLHHQRLPRLSPLPQPGHAESGCAG